MLVSSLRLQVQNKKQQQRPKQGNLLIFLNQKKEKKLCRDTVLFYLS